MELFLGVLLGIGVIYLKRDDSKKSVSGAVHRAFGVYADAAALLTFSVQLASVVILIKKDFGHQCPRLWWLNRGSHLGSSLADNVAYAPGLQLWCEVG